MREVAADEQRRLARLGRLLAAGRARIRLEPGAQVLVRPDGSVAAFVSGRRHIKVVEAAEPGGAGELLLESHGARVPFAPSHDLFAVPRA